jgi:hypothetical protein
MRSWTLGVDGPGEGTADAPFLIAHGRQDEVDRAAKANVGRNESDSALTVTWYDLFEDDWSAGDRDVICTVDTRSDTTGSIKGSRR